MLSVIHNVSFFEFFLAFDPEVTKHLHVWSTEPYIYSFTEVDSQNNFSGMTESQDELAADFSNEVNSLQPQIAKKARAVRRKQFAGNVFFEFSPTEQTFSKKVEFSEPHITDSDLQHPLRVLNGNNDVFGTFFTMLEKARKNSQSN